MHINIFAYCYCDISNVVASYGLIKPLFLAPVDPSNPNLVFLALVLSGSFGDALGSIFRVPMEIVYKRIQACQTNDGVYI